MYGSPLRTTIVLLLVFVIGGGAALGYILRKQPTSKPDPIELAETSTALHKIPCWLTLRSAHPIESATLVCNEIEIELDWLSETEAEAELSVADWATLVIDLKWKEGTPETALLIVLEPEDEKAQERTVWAQGSLRQELSYQLEQGREARYAR